MKYLLLVLIALCTINCGSPNPTSTYDNPGVTCKALNSYWSNTYPNTSKLQAVDLSTPSTSAGNLFYQGAIYSLAYGQENYQLDVVSASSMIIYVPHNTQDTVGTPTLVSYSYNCQQLVVSDAYGNTETFE